MTGDLVLQSAVAWLLLLIGSAVAVAAVHALARRRFRRLATSGRVFSLVVVGWLPVLIASLVLAGCYAPWVLAAMGWGHDHCDHHGGHVHLCLEHIYPAKAGLLSWGLFGVVAAWLALGLSELAKDVESGLRLQRSLVALSEGDGGNAAIVDAEIPLSVTAGLWSPRIFVTSALVRVLSPLQRRAVLEHERCHARERHALLKLVASIGAVWLPRSTRRALLADVALACERRSDEAAADALGDRLEVAAALLATQRALRHRAPLGVLSFQGSDGFEARIRGLTERARNVELRLGRIGVAIAAAAALAVVAGNQLHHGMETVLSLFLS